MELHDVSYEIDNIARPLLHFFSSENRLLWFRYREYDLAHLKLVFEFSIYKVLKSVQYGVYKDWIRRIGDFLEYGPRLISSRILYSFHISNTVYWSSGYGVLSIIPLRSLKKYTIPSIDTSLNHEEDDLEIDEPQSDIIPIRRSTRTRHAPDRMCLYIDAEEHELGDLGEPANYKAALLDPESDKWLNAMNVEMQSMKDNEVWDLVDLPPNGKTVGSKWLFKKKTNMDGAVHTYKARLVAKGYTQTTRIDYEETFSPVADIRAIRILIAIAAYYDYEIWQMDVKTAFLNRYLSEEVYMEQPEGFVNPKYPNRVCKLKRSIYGLKQASRQWNKQFDDEIKKFGFTQNRDEPCVYLKASGSNVTFLIFDFTWRIQTGSIPMQDKLRLSKSQGASTPAELKRMENVPYTLVVSSIIYMEMYTALMLRSLQNINNRFQQNTIAQGFLLQLIAWISDDADASKSQTRYVFHFTLRCLLNEECQKSIFCNFNSAESEYIAAYDLPPKGVHYLREVIEYGDIKLEKVHTDDNLADPFTKALAFPKHSEHTRNIGMLPASSLM
ncbi:retrotransposon protein, putative, ty1-copia subclass [Tanacetum coccineum]